MSNHNIVYMSIAINNVTSVKTCDMHTFNCDWKKAITKHKRQYQLQLNNNLKQLIDFKTFIYIVHAFCVIL